MPQVRSNDAIIDYVDEGLGDPALLLLPEWCGTRAAFDAVIDGLGAKRRVLALDWRGHGSSGASPGDFGAEDLVQDVLAVVADSGAQSVVPVALAHAGWVAIDVRRRLGHLVPGLVLVDWIVTEAPEGFLATLEDVRSDADRDEAVAGLLQQWQAGATDPRLGAMLADMGAASGTMWDRAAREIEGSYARHGSPLRALSQLEPPPPVLHLVPAADDALAFERQRAYAAEHHWFHAAELPARSHFPLFEAPQQAEDQVERFVARVGGRQACRRVS
jgi:pimeloyl-ACP methyl ester carboxylesterase